MTRNLLTVGLHGAGMRSEPRHVAHVAHVAPGSCITGGHWRGTRARALLPAGARAPAEGGEEVAVDAAEPGGVALQVEAVHLHHVHLVAVAGVGEGDLAPEVGDQPQRLEVAVELRHGGHGHARQLLHHVAHRHVVRQPHLVRHRRELAARRHAAHSLR